MNPFGVVHKGYGVGAHYKRTLVDPTVRVLAAKAGKLRPVKKPKAQIEPKHKKPLQLGF